MRNYSSTIEIQKWLATMKNFDNIAVKVLTFNEELEIENVDLYGKLLIDLVSMVTHLTLIKKSLQEVLITEQSSELEEYLEVFSKDVFEKFINTIDECFSPEFSQPQSKKNLAKIFWVKDKTDVAIDLSRISFARTEERSDEVLKQYKHKIVSMGYSVKMETNKNGIFLKIRFDNKMPFTDQKVQ